MDNLLIMRSARLLAAARYVVCLTGAGASAESGLPTFRDPLTGHWSKFDPEKLASQQGFRQDPGLVWRWYMDRFVLSTERAKPNPGHHALAQLEQICKEFLLVTQNVDNLHEQAGSRNVIHLHGNLSRFFCNGCRREHELLEVDKTAEMPPDCSYCGDLVRPGVVWFGEQLPAREIEGAWAASQQCDVMIVVGTSGIVYPAAHLPYVAQDANGTIVDINPEQDALSAMADIYIQGTSSNIVPRILDAMTQLK